MHYQGQRGKGVYDVAFEGLIRNVENVIGKQVLRLQSKSTKVLKITPCKECGGRRLKKESLAVKVGIRIC